MTTGPSGGCGLSRQTSEHPLNLYVPVNTLLSMLTPAALAVLGLLVMAAPLLVARWWDRQRGRRHPLRRNLLRSPGSSLRDALQAVGDKVDEYLLLGATVPFGGPALYLWQAWLADRPVTVPGLTVVTVLSLAVALYAGVRLTGLYHHRRILRLALDGELAVGEELTQLLSRGFRVYHDFPAEGFNIDHVVIGPTGVFAVETKARSKPTSGDGKRDATVVFDGRQLVFPWGAEAHCLEQAARQAAWLQRWLRQAVGEPVPVQAVLALPGWFVERKGRGAVLVFNPGETMALFPKMSGARLDEKQVAQVAYQVEQRCRTVEPQRYGGGGERLRWAPFLTKSERPTPHAAT